MLKNSLVIIVLIIIVFSLVTIALIREIIKLAYTDVLTGEGNSTAYRECMDNINKQIISGEKVAFSVVLMI